MTTQENQITAEHVEAELVRFIKKMEIDEIQIVCEHGGFIWFRWQGVAPEHLVLHLHIGDPDDRANREFLDRGDVYIPYTADQDLFDIDGEDGFFFREKFDGEPHRPDGAYFEKIRMLMIKCFESSAEDAWNTIVNSDTSDE